MNEIERIYAIPDLFVSEEVMWKVNESFGTFLNEKGYGKRDISSMMNVFERPAAEQLPNIFGERIRQLVTNVLVFEIPDVLYEKWRGCQPDKEEAEAVLLRDAELLGSVRLKGGGESRLYGKLSAAFGGHVDEKDKESPLRLTGAVRDGKDTKFDAIFHNASVREMKEELSASDEELFTELLENALKPIGIINSGAGEVEKLHLGLFQLLVVPVSLGIKVREVDKLEMVRVPFESFLSHYLPDLERKFELENWARIVFNTPISHLSEQMLASISAAK